MAGWSQVRGPWEEPALADQAADGWGRWKRVVDGTLDSMLAYAPAASACHENMCLQLA